MWHWCWPSKTWEDKPGEYGYFILLLEISPGTTDWHLTHVATRESAQNVIFAFTRETWYLWQSPSHLTTSRDTTDKSLPHHKMMRLLTMMTATMIEFLTVFSFLSQPISLGVRNIGICWCFFVTISNPRTSLAFGMIRICFSLNFYSLVEPKNNGVWHDTDK